MPGSGYTMPTIDFDMPDDPNGVQAKAHAVGVDASGAITAIVLDEPGSGYATAPNVVIRDGTIHDPIIGGIDAFATATLEITSIVVDTPGDGYISAPTVIINDPNGFNATATATVGAGAITAINLVPDPANPTAPVGGSGYITGGGIPKFVDALPGLCNPAETDPAGCHSSVPDERQVHPDWGGGQNQTDNWYRGRRVRDRSGTVPDLVLVQPAGDLARGYVQIAGLRLRDRSRPALQREPGSGCDRRLDTGYCGVTPPQWLGPTIAATKDKPVRIIFRNLLPADANASDGTSEGDLFLPTDSTLMGSGMAGVPMLDPEDLGSVTDEARNPRCTQYPKSAQCFKDNRATLHLHGGISPWISDGTPHQWITPATEDTAWPQGVSVSNVPDMGAAGCDANDDGCMTFYYTNQQSARLDVLPRPCLGHHPAQRVRGRGCRLPDLRRDRGGADGRSPRKRWPRYPAGRPGPDLRAG